MNLVRSDNLNATTGAPSISSGDTHAFGLSGEATRLADMSRGFADSDYISHQMFNFCSTFWTMYLNATCEYFEASLLSGRQGLD